MSGNIQSVGVDVAQTWAFAIQANFSGVNGTSVCGLGTLKLQVSNDEVKPLQSGPPQGTDPAQYVQNWVDYSGTLSSTTASIGSSNFLWNISYPGYRWTRLVYVAASGTGVLSATYFGKNA